MSSNCPADIQSRGSVTDIPESVSMRIVKQLSLLTTEKDKKCEVLALWTGIGIHLLGIVFLHSSDGDDER